MMLMFNVVLLAGAFGTIFWYGAMLEAVRTVNTLRTYRSLWRRILLTSKGQQLAGRYRTCQYQIGNEPSLY
jgi:hypothetical protein